MPAFPRANNKATKIAYKILGIPSNMKHYMKARGKQDKQTRRETNLRYNDGINGVGGQ
jgi:hypothetical protein